MQDLIKLYDLLYSKLPKSAKTKISKSGLDRGGDGVFTKRRKRSDIVLIPFESFKNNWKFNSDTVNRTYLNGYRVLCSPVEYFQNIELLENKPILVRYQNYIELEEYPAPIDWSNVKKDRMEYSINEIIWVKDIKNLDKHKNKGKSCYVGPKLVGQHEMDYAIDDEILKVKMCLLYQMIKCHDFKTQMSKNKFLEKFDEYSIEFEKTTLYTENPKLQEYTTKYGHTVCPEIIKFPIKEHAKLSFKDIEYGVIIGDEGREKFNRTTTKINLHHLDRLISGKLNHNHKNVFLGSAAGNLVDAALRLLGNGNIKLEDLLS